MNQIKKQYWDMHVPQNIKMQVNCGAIAAYISAGLTLLLAVAYNPASFLDFFLILGMGLGVHLAKSRACAIIIMANHTISRLLQFGTGVQTNVFGIFIMILFFVLYGMGIKGTFEFQRMWDEHQIQAYVRPSSEDSDDPANRV